MNRLLILLFLPALTIAQTGTFSTDGWTPDYCNRVGVAVWPDAEPGGVMHAMARGDDAAVREACGVRLDPQAIGCALNTSGNHWTIWYRSDCVWQHMSCHAMYQTQEHVKYQSAALAQWLDECGDGTVQHTQPVRRRTW